MEESDKKREAKSKNSLDSADNNSKNKNKKIESQKSPSGSMLKNTIFIILVFTAVIAGLLFKIFSHISKLESSVSDMPLQIHQNLENTSSKNVDRILNKIDFDNKLKSEHSDLVIEKAHRFEYLRIVNNLLNGLKDGDLSTKDLELLQYFDNPKFSEHLKHINDLIADDSDMLSDQELMLKISEKLKIYPKIITLEPSAENSGDATQRSIQSIKRRLSKLFSIRDLNDQKLTVRSFKNKYKSKNWVFNLLENGQYQMMLVILSKLQAKNQLIDVFATLQRKKNLQSRLLKMQKILLE